MAKASPLFETFWIDAGEWDPLQMLIFINAFATEIATVSGIYRTSPRKIGEQTHIPKKLVAHYLGADPLSKDKFKAELLKAVDYWIDEFYDDKPHLKNIEYDKLAGVLFAVKKLQYTLGGRPDLMALSIIGDHYITRKAPHFWREFAKLYKSRIDASPALIEFFAEILDEGKTIEILEKKGPVQKKPPKQTKFNSDLVKDIDKMLARYSAWKHSDDRDIIFKVIRYLTSHMTTQKPYALEKRHEMLGKLDKKPVEQIIQACNSFIEANGIFYKKRFNYFWGIVRGSAESWMIEYQAEKDKREFELEGNKS